MVNQFYFYAVDDDFGPFFLKYCSYFPYNAKLCINGHDYLKRQLTKRESPTSRSATASCAAPTSSRCSGWPTG